MFWTDTRRRVIAAVVLLATTTLMSAISGLHLGLSFFLLPITIVASFFVTALALRYFARVSWADSSRTLALPISLYVSIIALAQGVMSEDGILIANAILAPVAGGVIFFASLSGVGNTEVQTETNASSFVLPSLLVSALPYFLLAQFIEFEHSLFFEIPTWVFCLLTFSSFFFFQRRNENLVDRIVNAGCYNFIFQSGYMVFVYASGIFRSGVDEHFTIYVSSVVSYMFPPIVFFLVALMVALLNGRTTEVKLRNWHLVEGYLFLVAMVIAPPSIIEYLIN